MKKSVLLLITLICACTMSFAKKKAAFVISPYYINYQEMCNKSQETQHKTFNETPAVSITATNSSAQKEAESFSMDDLNVDDQSLKDLCYIAYLYKSQSFNRKYQKEVNAEYNIENIQQLVRNYSEEELKIKSKGHSKQLKKYSL